MKRPYRSETLSLSSGKRLELLYYHTDLKTPDGAVTDDELTPVVLIEDKVINDNGITVFVDPKSLAMLFGSQLIFKEEGINCGIEIINPNSTATCGCGESFSV